MSWRQPAHLFGPSSSDRAMMVEVLELLASDSPSQDRSASTTTSSVTTDSHNSSITGSNHSSVSGDTNHGDNGDVQGTLLDVGDQTRSGSSHLVTLPSSGDNFEEKYPAGYRTDEEQEQATLGFVQRMQDSMSSSPMSCTTRPAAAPPFPMESKPPPYQRSPWSPQFANAGMLGFLGGDLGLIGSSAAASAPNLPPPTAALPAIPAQVVAPTATAFAPQQSTARRSMSPHQQPRASASVGMSKVLPTGQRVHVMNSAEFDELRRKLRMQTASRRYRKRKKQEARQQKTQILELQAELARLQELEAQTKQYQQRSTESLERELKIHKDEAADLSDKVQAAAQEELDWINAMNNIRK